MDDKLIKALLKQYKDTVIKSASEVRLKNLEPVSTGSIGLDLALGVPLAYGIVEFAGQEGCGKTTIALEGGANAQKKGFKLYYFNIERSLNEKSMLGLGLNQDEMVVINPESAEATLDIVEAILRSSQKNFIILDSIASMVSEKVMAESASKEFMALLPRLLSKWLPKSVDLIERSKSVLLLVNQLRDNVGGYGAPDVTPGGRGIKFYASERVYFRTNKSKRISGEEEDNYQGHLVMAEVVKNRFNPPFKKAEFPIIYLPGPHIDRFREVATLATDLAVVERGGAWITLPNGDKVQGMEAFMNVLREHPEMFNEINDKLMEMLK